MSDSILDQFDVVPTHLFTMLGDTYSGCRYSAFDPRIREWVEVRVVGILARSSHG